MQIFLVFALFIAVLAVIFAIQNNAPATVSFALWDFQGSLALVLLVSLVAGALISIFVSMPSNIKARWTIRQQRKKMTELEENISNLNLQLETAQKKIDQIQMSGETPAPKPVPLPAPTNEDKSPEIQVAQEPENK